MKRLEDGVRKFQSRVYPQQRGLFQSLAEGQRPNTLFITCSDSRIDPSLLTQTDPGELFVIRNAGNLVPPWGSGAGGEAATLEYAVKVLGVREIVVCGHSRCGAMGGLIDPASLTGMPGVGAWLRHATETRFRLGDLAGVDPDACVARAVEENVRVQLEHLRSYPWVEQRIKAGELTLHGWVYRFEDGEVLTMDRSGFRPIAPTHAA
jgi:carbonic anhydrase